MASYFYVCTVVMCNNCCPLVFVLNVNRVTEEKMLRRKPTRLELKIDDTEEFESVKKELEVSHLISINQH